MNDAGSEVSVGTTGMCGSMVVTVNEPADCNGDSAVKGVRISGGTWQNPIDCCVSVFCNNCCSFPFGQCDVGGCTGSVPVSPPPASQIVEDDNGNWWKVGTGAGCVNRPYCRPCNVNGTTNEGCTPFGGCYGNCGGGSFEFIWEYFVCEWKCAC